MAWLTAALPLTGHQCDSQDSPGKSCCPPIGRPGPRALTRVAGAGTVEVSAWRADVGEHSDDSCRVHGRRRPLSHVSARKVWKERSLPPRQVMTSGCVRRTTRLRCPIWGTSRRREHGASNPVAGTHTGAPHGHGPGTRPGEEVQAAGWGCAASSRRASWMTRASETRPAWALAQLRMRHGESSGHPGRQVSLTAHTAQPGRGLQPLRPHSHSTP